MPVFPRRPMRARSHECRSRPQAWSTEATVARSETMAQNPFDNARALIFGSGRNIGRAVALEFARRGAAVAVADIDLAAAEETAQLIVDAGGKAVAIRCDVTDDDAVAAASSQAIDQLGEIDIVMSNAGVLHSGNPEDIPAAEWQRMFNCNLMGCVRANNIFMPRMI